MPSKTEENERSLSQLINIATRSVHTKLNKLVLARLPLALPPQADDASQYVSGLLHIAPIYISFESLWRTILDSPVSVEEASTEDTHVCAACDPAAAAKAPPASPDVHSAPDGNGLDAPHRPVICSRIHSLLAHLHLEGLQRSRALQDDLAALTGWSSRTLAEQLNDAAESPVLADFLRHTKSSVRANPHVLLAYAWVLYMALFSGGRFIRASLEGVDAAFWVPASAQHAEWPSHKAAINAAGNTITTVPCSSGSSSNAKSFHSHQQQSQQQPHEPNQQEEEQNQNHHPPLDFFRFATPDDGEDLKQTFKGRLAQSESLLTPAERDDVVQEARCIFEFMVCLCGELDDICGTDREAESGTAVGAGARAAGLLSLRSRDSVVVEKERRQLMEMARRVERERERERDREREGSGNGGGGGGGVAATLLLGRKGKGKGSGEGGVRFQG
ncbi:Uu.00g088960.m01.CDS01 [Anthostomella pinea]|uniref:Uu.00g088960.m01.CDS01 n=1 Tax=Anthostomella pinea TaxID=933095 RepID=A0AAI8YK46_9PEZI|nr:Uu.00g088960.m01.CDS01 [Anthostomella pinea]